ncbi:MAG: hypothetical protein DCC65_14140 [Planctomycetota bacterium]|nr:MAG: hypothetical protein DCC65_14140 [Planctomycetota bacterium]
MKRFTTCLAIAAAAVVLTAGSAQAGPVFFENYEGSVFFTSDLESPKTITLPKFDNMGGLRTLLDVQVTVCHEGSVDMAGDNDDEFQGATVRGRMIRSYFLSGAGVASTDTETVNTAFVNLSADDGDGGDNDIFDPTGPDGHDFGTIFYGKTEDGVSPHLPSELLYDSNGPGSVMYNVLPVLMVNDLQFEVNPDAWQLEVENPLMVVKVRLQYTYVPEPATAGLLGLGGLMFIRRKR